MQIRYASVVHNNLKCVTINLATGKIFNKIYIYRYYQVFVNIKHNRLFLISNKRHNQN